MTALSRDLASKRPAELIVRDSRNSVDFAGPFPQLTATPQEIEGFLAAEACGRSQSGDTSRGTRIALRITAVIFLLLAAVEMWFAATGNRL